jgi:hypothetical protein
MANIGHETRQGLGGGKEEVKQIGPPCGGERLAPQLIYEEESFTQMLQETEDDVT